MVERVDQPLELSGGDLGSISGYSPQRARVQQAETEDNLGLQALSGLLDIAGGVAEQAFVADVKQQYMQGQRARMLGQSMEDVDTDVFSKPFVRGGFQDQDYRMQQANLDQEMRAYIADKGRTVPPEEFVAVLAQKSSATLEGMGDGLSPRGRALALAAQTELEQSLITSHNSAYKSYSIEQAGKRITADGNARMSELGRAKLGQGDVANASNRVVSFVQDLWANPAIPDEMRLQVAEQYLVGLVAPGNDHRDVVNALRQDPGGLLDQLPFESRTKIAAAVDASEKRTKSRDALFDMGAAAAFEQSIDAGTATNAQVMQYTTTEVMAKRMTADQQKAIWDRQLKSQTGQEDTALTIDQLNRGDLQGLAARNIDIQDAFDVFYTQAGKSQMPLAEKTNAALRMGTQIGTLPKQFAQDVSSAVQALTLNPDAANPEQVALLQTFSTSLFAMDQTRPGAAGLVLGKIPEAQRASLTQMLIDAEGGVDPQTSLLNTAARQETANKLAGASKGASTAATEKAILAELKGRLPSWVPGTEQQSGAGFETLRLAISQEAIILNSQQQNSGLTPAALAQLAASNVQGRTLSIDPENSPPSRIVLPRNVPLERYTGPRGNPQRTVAALEKLYPADSGFTRDFYTAATGIVYTTQKDADGNVVQQDPVDWPKVRSTIEADVEALGNSQRKAYQGEVVQSNGNPITLNGVNSAGVPAQNAYDFRKELLRLEGGVQLTAHEDARGVAVGVGQNVTGKLQIGDTITPVQAEAMFNDSSDKAMLTGVRLANQLGVTAAWGKLALAGAAFQLGGDGIQQHTKTLQAIKDKDFTTFEHEVRNNSLWSKQTPERTEWFISKMKGHFFGNPM